MLVLVFTACGEGEGHEPPQTIEWPPQCEGTLDANACVTLDLRTNDFVRANAPGDKIGTAFWALYKEGDVDLVTGARAGEPLYSGEVANVDLSTENRSHLIHIANMAARKYQALLQLDDDVSGGPNDGDLVTLPQRAFNALAGEYTERTITFDHYCGAIAAGECDP